MTSRPQIRAPGGFPGIATCVSGPEADAYLHRDLQTLRQIVESLSELEHRLDVSPIPPAVAERGYFTPDEDDRVRQGVLLYRNSRLAAYEIILRYRNYAELEAEECRLRCFLVAFGAALVLYSKSLRIISFAEHEPMLRAKINEPDIKYDMEAGFFDDVLAGYSRLCNYKSIARADLFWRMYRRSAHELAARAGGDWAWLVDLIRRQRNLVRNRLQHVLWQRLRHDWQSFCRSLLSPFQQARHGVEGLLRDHLAEPAFNGRTTHGISTQLMDDVGKWLRPGDVLLVRDESRLSATILPGFWTHAALFIGRRGDLERLGLAKHPYVVRHWERIPDDATSAGWVIEALCSGVKLTPLEECLQVDHMVVLRPCLSESDVALAIGEAIGHLGKPYDFDFDFNASSRIVCTGLIYRSFDHRGNMKVELVKRLGRFTLTGDDIMAQTLDASADGKSGWSLFEPVALVLKRHNGHFQTAGPERIVPLLKRIRRGWRPARRIKASPKTRA